MSYNFSHKMDIQTRKRFGFVIIKMPLLYGARIQVLSIKSDL
jgi:hypothetical protein